MRTVGSERTPMFLATKVTKRFGDRIAIDSLDLIVPRGEIYCVVGGNGAGKTTTLHMFLNFISPTTGTAYVDGFETTAHPREVQRRISYIPERAVLYPQFTALENLEYFASLASCRRRPRDELKVLLDRVHLRRSDFDRRVSFFSKGMRQKTAIAIALAKSSMGILMDEPTSGLDPIASRHFKELLCELREEGTTVLVTTHDIYQANDVANRIGVMANGRLLAEMKPGELTQSELERWVLGAVDREAD